MGTRPRLVGGVPGNIEVMEYIKALKEESGASLPKTGDTFQQVGVT
jgi:hypothetical protein